MATRVVSLGIVAAAFAALALSGCSEQESSASVQLDRAAVETIALSFDGVPLVPTGYGAETVDSSLPRNLEFLAPGTVRPKECRAWHVERQLFSETDAGSGDWIVPLGVGDWRALLASKGEYASVLVYARVFKDSTTATAFLGELAAHARACPDGYDWEQVAMVAPGGATEGLTATVTSGDVSIEREWSLRGARILEVNGDEESFFGTYSATNAERRAYIAYGNVLVRLDSGFSGSDQERPVSDEEWDDLIEQIVSGLEGAASATA